MTAKLELVRRYDLGADIDTLSLLSYTNGLSLVNADWTPGMARAGEKTTAEAMLLIAKGTSHDNLSAVIQGLADKVDQINRASDPAEGRGVWLRMKQTNETGTLAAYITTARHGPKSSIFSRETNVGSVIQRYGLEFERTPHFENDQPTVYATTAINATGGTFDFTTYPSNVPVNGNKPARLGLLTISGSNAAPNDHLERFWIGFRSDRFGTRANFQPTWSLRLAGWYSLDTTGGSAHADATAKDGYITITTFAAPVGAALTRRVTCRIIDVTANHADQRGEYLVLLRARLSAAGTVRVRMADGFYNQGSTDNQRIQSRVPISSTSWKLYEIGTVTLPNQPKISADERFSSIGIDAELVTGTPYLYMDCLILIPTGEGFVYVEGGTVYYSSPTAIGKIDVRDLPDGNTKLALNYDPTFFSGGQPAALATPKIQGGVPTGNVIAVVAGQSLTASDIGNAVTLGLSVCPHWDLLRGAS